jgi:hypothetical protein
LCLAGLFLSSSIPPAVAQEKAQAPPQLVTYWGASAGPDGKARTGAAGVTFSLYKDQQGGAPLWMETQNVTLDSAGGYSAQIGATNPEGLPIGLFASGEARWLEVQVDGQPPAQRVLLVSVPYALKAVDAQTLGGLPASAYALAAASSAPASGAAAIATAATSLTPRGIKSDATPAATDVTGAGTAGFIPVWNSSSNLADSVIEQKSGAVGIGTVSSAKLSVLSSSTNAAIVGSTSDAAGIAIQGQTTDTSGGGTAVVGILSGTSGTAIVGQAGATSGSTVGVNGTNASDAGTAVLGQASSATGETNGVRGTSASSDGTGVSGENTATTGANWGVSGTVASDGGTGVLGTSNATTGTNWGVYGIDNSTDGFGVQGQANATSGLNYGVLGFTSSGGGHGVAGSNADISGLGTSLSGTGSGVWGDTVNGTVGVLATADGNEALAAYNNASNVATMFVENQEDSTNSSIVFATFSAFGGFCDIFVSGNLQCSGSVGGHAVVGGSKDVALYSVQAAENWMEDAGSGQLHNGVALVTLDAEYAQTVNTGMDYHVFLTPNGDCKGLYVTQKSGNSFEVHELGGGASSIAFDYRIMARRKGFENVRMADLTGKIQRDSTLHAGPHPSSKPVAAHAARPKVPARQTPAPAKAQVVMLKPVSAPAR